MKAFLILRLLVFGWLISVLPIAAQGAGGSVFGLVVCNDTNAPARGAHVYLVPLDPFLPQGPQGPTSGADGIYPSTNTDFTGAYKMETVKPGAYLVSASMDGYLNDVRLALSKLERVKGGEREDLIAALAPVTVKPGGDARKDVVLRRLGAISGRVTVDAGGLPGRAQVTATRIGDEDSRSAALDDRGMYRIAGLPEGKYRLSILIHEAHVGYMMPKGGGIQIVPVSPGTTQLTVYAPEALEPADASVVELKDGDEITDFDISIPTRLLHSVGGVVMDGGAPAAGVEVSFQRLGDSMETHTATSMPDGSFRFDLLRSGTYKLRAGSGETTVQLQDADIVDAAIDMHPRTGRARK